MATPARMRKSIRSSSESSATTDTKGWQKNVLCKFYRNGICSRDQDCQYSHDLTLSNRGTLPCKYFSQGTCASGENCRFSHGQPITKQESEEGKNLHLKGTISKLNPNAKEFTMSPQRQNSSSKAKSWASAPAFVPRLRSSSSTSEEVTVPEAGPSKNRTWAEIVDPVGGAVTVLTVEDAESQLCPYSMMGECRYGEHCAYVHGDVCEMCGSPVLHPGCERQRQHHKKVCMAQHEADMEMAFAVKRSKDKTCGICMEVVMDKKPAIEARFGIMPNCNHCYCLSCLRTWRQAEQFENKIVRACPECRQTSDYICPSRFWIDTKEEKENLLATYKEQLKKKQCKYFDRGRGDCPFGNKCFYRHESSDGVLVDVGPPEQQKRRAARAPVAGFDDDLEASRALIQRIFLNDFLALREELAAGIAGAWNNSDDVLDFLDLLSDTDSDY